MHLYQEKCVPCKKGTPPLDQIEAETLLKAVHPDWQLIDGHRLHRHYPFKNFKDALAFSVKIGLLAEEVGHHPNISLTWGKVDIDIFTHSINGLSKSDFIFAAKLDRL